MKTIASNEEYVRLRIYEGDLEADQATKELLRLEKCQHEAARADFNRVCRLLDETRGELTKIVALLS